MPRRRRRAAQRHEHAGTSGAPATGNLRAHGRGRRCVVRPARQLAVVGQLSIGELVVALGATLGILRLGVLGEEAFPLKPLHRGWPAQALERGCTSSAPRPVRCPPTPHRRAGTCARPAPSDRSFSTRNHRWFGWLLLFVFLDAAAPPVLAVTLAAVTNGARRIIRTARRSPPHWLPRRPASVALAATASTPIRQNRIIRVAGAQLDATVLFAAACSPTIEHLRPCQNPTHADRRRDQAGMWSTGLSAPSSLRPPLADRAVHVPVGGRPAPVVARSRRRGDLRRAHPTCRAFHGDRGARELGAVLRANPVVLAYRGALWLIALDTARGQRSPGSVVLVALATVGLARVLPLGGEAARRRGRWTARRRSAAMVLRPRSRARQAVSNARRAPRAIVSGMDFVDVSVGSPGSEIAALRHIGYHLPAAQRRRASAVPRPAGPPSSRWRWVCECRPAASSR